MTILLKNAKIYDGTANPPFPGDLLLENDRIVRVAPRIDEGADKVYDLQGKSVAPGFIDSHSHNDWFAICKDCLPCFEPFIRQGITVATRRATSPCWPVTAAPGPAWQAAKTAR